MTSPEHAALSLRGKRALVTGASGGIGAEIARAFAEAGAEVGIHYNSSKESALRLQREIRAAGGKAELFAGDLLEQQTCARLVDEFAERMGGIDILVNNAGAVFKQVPFEGIDAQTFDKVFALNVRAPFYLTAAAFRHMEGRGGRIINISSVNVRYGGSARSLHYVASKAALESLTIGFAREGAKHNILVNAIRCGLIDTPMRTRIEGYSEEDFQKRIKLVPLGHPGTPEDIARMALFLASDAGRFITKEIFTVAGGD